MGFHFYYLYADPLYLIIVIISLVLMLGAQLLVKGSFSKYSKISNSRNLTGADAARKVLENHGIYNVDIQSVNGNLTDHYDPRTNVIRLSENVYNSNSIAAVGIAAHEAGHAVQYAQNYTPVKVRTAIIPFANYGPTVGIILMLLGVLINMFNMIVIGLILFAATFMFQLVTLPVEFNASRRAIETISETNLLDSDELRGAKRVLTAAALTYVAAMLQSLLTLLYYALRFLGRGNRRR